MLTALPGIAAEQAPLPVTPAAKNDISPAQPLKPLQGTYSTVSLTKPRRVKELGIEVVALRLTSNGFMLDFRYRVLDPEKAKPLIDKKIKPKLIDQATGTRMDVPAPPKIGSLRQTPRSSKAGQVYFAIFANAGQLIRPGNKVTIEYGEHKIENLVVE
jgi:hypothetical protein